MRLLAYILTSCLFCVTSATAQEHKPWVVRTVNKLEALIDTMATSGIDKRYIKVPDRPWQVMVKTNTSDMDLRSKATLNKDNISELGAGDDFNIETIISPNATTSVGAWIGYRGYGLGLSYSLTKNSGRYFTIGATGSNYGLNLRTLKYTTHQMEANIWAHDGGEFMSESDLILELFDDIHVYSLVFDGYYVFNGKRFSYAAAYDQSVIQTRSAGSLLLGAMWSHLSVDYAEPRNGLFMQLLNNVGKIKIQEGSIGLGYAYNWVPFKNLLINVMVVPMVTIYNRNKAVFYDCNYDIFLEKDEEVPGGKKSVLDDESSDWTKDITIKESGEAIKYGNISLNVDCRASITYNWDRLFFNVYGQWSHFRNTIESNRLRLSTWYVNASLGLRL